MRALFFTLVVLAVLPSCAQTTGDPGGEGGGLPPASAFAGKANAVGVEFAFGKHAFGFGLTYRKHHDWQTAPADAEESHPPFSDGSRTLVLDEK